MDFDKKSRRVRGPAVAEFGNKPDFVPAFAGGDHFSLDQRCRWPRSTRPVLPANYGSWFPNKDCLRLHAVGFSMPCLSPNKRCALTAPFHPCHALPREPFGGFFSVALSLIISLIDGRSPSPCSSVSGLSSPEGIHTTRAITYPKSCDA